MYNEDELLDLFDYNEELVGTVKRAEYYQNPGKYDGYYLRAAELFIQNDKGQLWIPRRTAKQKIAPNGLDYSCGGHVGAGEDYVTGLLREAEEEINISLSPDNIRLVRVFRPTEENPWFRAVFLYKSNDVPDYNTDDFSEYYWLTPAELLEKLKAGEPAKTSMLATVKELAADL